MAAPNNAAIRAERDREEASFKAEIFLLGLELLMILTKFY
jgi:hypothetical protein